MIYHLKTTATAQGSPCYVRLWVGRCCWNKNKKALWQLQGCLVAPEQRLVLGSGINLNKSSHRNLSMKQLYETLTFVKDFEKGV